MACVWVSRKKIFPCETGFSKAFEDPLMQNVAVNDSGGRRASFGSVLQASVANVRRLLKCSVRAEGTKVHHGFDHGD